MTVQQYAALVNDRLRARGAAEVTAMTLRANMTVAAGHAYGIGPDDCACQVIADRDDGRAAQ